MRGPRTLAAAVVLLSLSACLGGRGLVRQEYLLTPTATAAVSGGAMAAGPQPALGIGPVELPDYLRRPQIVTRSGNQLKPSDRHTWGGDLEADFARVLGENLSAQLPTDRVITFPWVDPSLLDYRVQVRVTRFEADSAGSVELVAHWLLVDGRSNDPLHVGRASIRERSGGSDYSARVDAMSRAVAELGAEIASEIRDQAAADR